MKSRLLVILMMCVMGGVMPARIVSASGPGSLIKLACPSGAEVNHPCKAVYYHGADGKRHAFPNERVFFTWYADFSSVAEVSATELAALSLGKNVTYRPGVRMVKFTTENKVYAVDRAGVLRWVTTEGIAISLYGADWNKKIDDISDVFFSNYPKGTAITSSTDFAPGAATTAATSIDTNF